ncbi:MAG: TraB/GumN family protein [Bacteroidales bacterium]|nr:TraB/GumN family protein [Bacteroidales bacterium]
MKVKKLPGVTIQKIITLTLTISISVFSFGQQKKLANSLLWEISSPKHKKTSYLFGTMHVSNKVAFHLQDSLLTAMNNVDIVGLELNPETWLYDMSHSEVFDAMVKSAHNNININRFYDLVSTYTVIDKSVLRTALVDNNNFINNLLYRFSGAANRNYEETTYLDLYIYQLGKKLKKDVIGLENFNKTMEMAIKAMQPDDDPQEDEKSKNNYEKQMNNFKIMIDIESAYRNWNLNDIDSLMKLTYISKNHEKYLIDDRNLIMLNGLDSIMQNGSIFCGVGAAHLPGEKGLIALLRSKGYTVRPVMDKETFSGKKKRDKVEQKLYSHIINDYTLPDASIKYSLPGELINIPTHNENQFLLYPDMVNGSYYAIYRLSHYQRLLGRTENYASLMVDSLLYENIPGKILTKKQITSNNNLPGIELASRLPSGDYMQFNIFYSPLEIIIIKAGGNHKTFESTEWNRFFNSITFNDDKINEEWITHNNSKSGFTVDIPKGFLECNFTNQNLINSRLQGYNKKTDAYYYLTANTINDYEYIEDDDFELSYITQLWSETLKSEIIEESTQQENNSIIHHAKIQFKDSNKKAWLKVILKGYNVFVMLTTDGNENSKNRFFDSFASFNLQNHHLCTLTDSSLLFTTQTDDLNWKKKNEIQHLLQKNASQLFNKYNKKIDNKVYYSSTSSAAIEVQRDELSKYKEIKSVDSYLLKRNTFYISKRHGNYLDTTSKYCTPVVNRDSIFSREVIIKDSSSVRAILMKNVLSKNSVYTLSTVIDTINGLTLWQKQFFDNFTPIDTGNYSYPLKSKKQRILSDMQSTDSTTIEYLSENFPRYYFIHHPDEVSHLFDFMKNDVFASFDLTTKSNIIESTGEIESIRNTYLDQLEAMYHNAGDTTEIQIAILTALSGIKTTDSYQLVSKLMEENLPLAEDDYMLYSLFFNLNDTLALSKELFPSILNQLPITEYTGLILELMTELAVENKLDYSL